MPPDALRPLAADYALAVADLSQRLAPDDPAWEPLLRLGQQLDRLLPPPVLRRKHVST